MIETVIGNNQAGALSTLLVANNWVKTGPHVMIVGAEAKSMFVAYPRDAKADPAKPYVM